MLIGRQRELAAVDGVIAAARSGAGAALCLEGEAGIGKTTVLDAAWASASELRRVRATGVEAESTIGHAGLADILTPLLDHLGELPSPMRHTLEAALGKQSAPTPGNDRHLVATATMALLAAAAAVRPVLVIVDDLHWLDPESTAALTFAARRLRHDAVAFLVARRFRANAPDPGMPVLELTGLPPDESRRLLSGVAPIVADRLIAQTAGNPLALIELTRALTPAQRRGSAVLPRASTVGRRLATHFGARLNTLSVPARHAMLLIAAAGGTADGFVVAALEAGHTDAVAALAELEDAGMLRATDGAVTIQHPLLRAVVLQTASAADRGAAHHALAATTAGRPELQLRHLVAATVGFDDDLARRVDAEAARERRNHGHAAASTLAELASRLTSDAPASAELLSSAVEDAFLAGNPERVRRLAAAVLDGADSEPVVARVRLTLGMLEEHAGSVRDARQLLESAATTGNGATRIRALAELAMVCYRLGSPSGMTAAAQALARHADRTDPEQEMLRCYTEGAALAFNGEWSAARPALIRALQLLEDEPGLRDDPRYLTTAILLPGWLREPLRVLSYVDRRLDKARALGALGVLPMALNLLAGGAQQLGWHEVAFGYAGEAVELGLELGYLVDVATAHEILAWEQAARGDCPQARLDLDRARQLQHRAEVDDVAVHLELVEAFVALCDADLGRVVTILERRLGLDDGRLPRGDLPLAVAPDLVEAYLGLGRRSAAVVLADRYDRLYRDAADADLRGQALRLRGMLADDPTDADGHFKAAHQAHQSGTDHFAAARTLLLHGVRLRREGHRREARVQLRAAAAGFTGLGLDGWTGRATTELAATGEQLRRGSAPGGPLTSQETRVALMVARGLSNKEVAAALFLSPKTVEHHVSAVLRKRELRSRTEIAVAFAPR